MNSSYNGGLTREQFLFYEMRITAKLLCEGLSQQEVISKVREENLFQFPTEKMIDNTKGRAHDGLDDAYNTARMIAKLEQNKDYKTLVERLRANEENQKPLTTSLGQLLQGLSLEPDEP